MWIHVEIGGFPWGLGSQLLQNQRFPHIDKQLSILKKVKIVAHKNITIQASFSRIHISISGYTKIVLLPQQN